MLYLVRYGEIFLKSEWVRRRWERKLMENIRKVMDCKIRRERGRLWVLTDDPKAKEKLGKVFGIVSFSECEHCKLEELDRFVLDFCRRKLGGAKTFAVRVKRVGTHDFTSQQKASELGALILKHFPHLKVDLNRPEFTLYVEIRGEDC